MEYFLGLISPQHSILLEHAAIDEELPVGSIQAVYYGKQDHRFSDKKSRVAMFKKTRQFFLSCLTSDTVTSVEWSRIVAISRLSSSASNAKALFEKTEL